MTEDSLPNSKTPSTTALEAEARAEGRAGPLCVFMASYLLVTTQSSVLSSTQEENLKLRDTK